MQTEDLVKIVDEIKRQKTEKQSLELKAVNKGCPTRLFDTLSSFSNQDDGGIYGKISVDALGKARPVTRNTVLANMLEFLNVTENRYLGILTIRKEFKEAGLPAPIFSVKHGEFTGMSRYYTMSTIIQPLVDDGKIKLTIPEKPKSSKQKYVKG